MATTEAAATADDSPPDSSKPLRKPLRRLDSLDVEASRVDGMPVSWGDRVSSVVLTNSVIVVASSDCSCPEFRWQVSLQT